MAQDGELPAGDFSTWLGQIRTALAREGDASVPCGTCTACCRASQFVVIDPDEVETLARIPSSLLAGAPGGRRGAAVIGYDDRGHCPLLTSDGCSIYAHRPRACRAYDCRVFAATGVIPREPGKEEVAARAERWRFSCPSPEDEAALRATRAAGSFLEAHPDVVSGGPSSHVAIAALAVHDLFAAGTPSTSAVRVELTRRRQPGR